MVTQFINSNAELIAITLINKQSIKSILKELYLEPQSNNITWPLPGKLNFKAISIEKTLSKPRKCENKEGSISNEISYNLTS